MGEKERKKKKTALLIIVIIICGVIMKYCSKKKHRRVLDMLKTMARLCAHVYLSEPGITSSETHSNKVGVEGWLRK